MTGNYKLSWQMKGKKPRVKFMTLDEAIRGRQILSQAVDMLHHAGTPGRDGTVIDFVIRPHIETPEGKPYDNAQAPDHPAS